MALKRYCLARWVCLSFVVAPIFVSTARALDVTKEPISAADLVSLRNIGGYFGALSVSADGNFIAIQVQMPDIAGNTFKLEWWVVPAAGGSATRVGDGGEVVLDTRGELGRSFGTLLNLQAQWSPDGQWIAYLRKDANEVQLWRSRSDGTEQHQVTRNAADVRKFVWRKDGAALYFEVGRERAQDQELLRAEGDRGYLVDERFVHGELKPLMAPCGHTIAGQPLPENCVPTVWVVKTLDDARESPATEAEKRDYESIIGDRAALEAFPGRTVQNIVRRKTDGRLAWFENESTIRFPDYRAPLTLYANDVRCSDSACHGQLDNLWWDGNRLILMRSEGHANGLTAVYSWSPGATKTRLIHRGEGKFDACEVSKGRMFCLYELPTQPRRLIAIDLDSKKLSTLFDPNPQMRQFALGSVERIETHDAFGNPTYAHLVLPPDYRRGKRYPLVIVQYRSRGFLNGAVGDEYPIFPMAAKGLAVLSFDCPTDWKLRASLSFDEAEAAMLEDDYERKMDLSALQAFIDILDKREIIDPARVGITGTSHGADNVSYILFHSNQFKAAATSGLWAPAHYFYLNANRQYRGFVKKAAQASTGPEAMEKARGNSILFNIEKVTTPLLNQVSDAEFLAVLPIHVALTDVGKPVETYVFPHEYHLKWQPRHKVAVAERAIDWFRFWLQDFEDGDPAKVGQYERWRQMRSFSK